MYKRAVLGCGEDGQYYGVVRMDGQYYGVVMMGSTMVW